MYPAEWLKEANSFPEISCSIPIIGMFYSQYRNPLLDCLYLAFTVFF